MIFASSSLYLQACYMQASSWFQAIYLSILRAVYTLSHTVMSVLKRLYLVNDWMSDLNSWLACLYLPSQWQHPSPWPGSSCQHLERQTSWNSKFKQCNDFCGWGVKPDCWISQCLKSPKSANWKVFIEITRAWKNPETIDTEENYEMSGYSPCVTEINMVKCAIQLTQSIKNLDIIQ